MTPQIQILKGQATEEEQAAIIAASLALFQAQPPQDLPHQLSPWQQTARLRALRHPPTASMAFRRILWQS